MRSPKTKSKSESAGTAAPAEKKNKTFSIRPEKYFSLLKNQPTEAEKLETLVKLTNELFHASSFTAIGKILFDNLKKFKRPGNWGIKLAIYDATIDEYWIIYPESQPCIGAPVPTRCKLNEVSYFSEIALATRKTLLIDDNHSEYSLKIDSRQIALSRGAMIFIPLFNHNKPIGLFSYSSSPENSIDDDLKNFFESISKLLTSSIIRVFDLNKPKKSNENHSNKENRYKRLINEITDYHYRVIVSNGETVKTVHNNSSLIVTGYDPKEFEDDSFLWFKMIYEADRDRVSNFIGRIFSGLISESIEHRITTKDGALRWVKNTIIPEKDKSGKMIAYDGLLQDITEQKIIEEQIKLSEERLNKVFNQSPDLLFIISFDNGMISDINKSAGNLFGLEKSALIGKSIVDVGLINRETFEQMKTDIITFGLYKNYDYKLAVKEDDIFDFDLSAELIEISGIRSILIIAEDRTKQRRMQAELERIHNLESIGILAGGIAHDFNNVLTAILGNISFVKMNISSEDRMFKFLSRAEDSCFKAKELSNKLLTFSKGGKPRIEMTEIDKLTKDYSILSLSGSNVFMNFQVKENINKVAVDQEQIRQVITSIIENAKEAMPHGGELIVRVENENISSKSTLPLQKGDYVKISFIDHGTGIPPENISKIFDPYFSTKIRANEKGMGLGLSISYSIINKHNGCITVSSEAGLGSTFSVYLPSLKE